MAGLQQRQSAGDAPKSDSRESLPHHVDGATPAPPAMTPAIARQALLTPTRLTATNVLGLQRMIGNQATGRLLSTGGASARRVRRAGAVIQRTLILNEKRRDDAEAVYAELGGDKPSLKFIKMLINLPGPPVMISTAGLADLYQHTREARAQPLKERDAKVAYMQFISHGAWTRGDTRATFNAFSQAQAAGNLGELGEFLKNNPNVVANLKAAGVNWDLSSTHELLESLGGAAVLDERIQIATWALLETGFTRMAVHEVGHATFQRMLLTGEKWTEAANKGQENPDERALEADGLNFYNAWRVLSRHPRYFFITDMPGDSEQAKGEGRRKYLAENFNEFCADSFMHFALNREELIQHVENLQATEGGVKQAWRIARDILVRYEDRMLGKEAAGKEATATLSEHRFTVVVAELKNAFQGPGLEVANIEQVREHLRSLRQAWLGMTPADQERHRSEALTTLDQYVMKVQRRRPAAAHLAAELGFTGL